MAAKEIKERKASSDSTSELLEQTLLAAAEGTTGLAASDRRKLVLSMGHLLQRVRGGEFLSQLKAEWQKYRHKGKIKDDYLDSNQHKECLQELLDFLDGESPDQLRFNALKNIFLRAASEDKTDRASVLPQQYMRIIRSLTAGEAILLFSAYQYTDTQRIAADWIRGIASKSQLRFPELVELHETELMKKQLITPRQHGRTRIITGHHGRLTTFGYNLCLFIESEGLDIGNDA